MPSVKNFRTALGGFNREDVVRYIEYMNNKHSAELEQLKTQLQTAKDELAKVDNTELLAKLEAAEARCTELEAQLAAGTPAPVVSGSELEIYRRAERAERLARERASQIYAQANAALADATVKVEAISDGMNDLFAQFDAKMQEGKQQLQDTVASLYAIRPEEE
ncbi:MAG: hypothetical protein IKA47_03455 [Oscillospiraceae bacterium]|nr:hypothetical protein [Oscillospiraceae bacterium]